VCKATNATHTNHTHNPPPIPQSQILITTNHRELSHHRQHHSSRKECSGPLVWRCAIGRDSFFRFPHTGWWGETFTLTLCNWFRHHPFSELSASAGELLHDSLADSNLHGHRPAISSRQHPLMGSNMSQHSDPISALSDHPASPVLLTSEWPTWSQIHRSNAVVTFFHHSVKFGLSFVRRSLHESRKPTRTFNQKKAWSDPENRVAHARWVLVSFRFSSPCHFTV